MLKTIIINIDEEQLLCYDKKLLDSVFLNVSKV